MKRRVQGLAGAAVLAAVAILAVPGCGRRNPPGAQAAGKESGLASSPASAPAATSTAPAAAGGSEPFTKNGVKVEFSLVRASAGVEAAPMREGEHAEVRFRITDAATAQPIRGLNPAAWMDMGQVIEGRAGEQRECKDKVGLYLKGIVGIRPLVDLNSYYLLVMNQDASISVIDPVVSMTGNTSLYTQVFLKRPGEDWVKGRDGKRLYVSMPRAGEVAVIDTETFKLVASIPAGESPLRVAVQPDGRYLWVGDDTADARKSGVSVVDTEKLQVVARIPTGRGHHEIAFTPDDRFAFVTNRDDGTVSVVDVRKLRKVKDVRTGSTPLSVAVSSLSHAAWVADGKDGTVTVIDGTTLEVAAHLTLKPGLGPLRFTQDGRFAFAVNTAENAVEVLDAADHRRLHGIPMPGKPYQVSFTRAFAYVRLLDSDRVQMVNLTSIGEGKTPIVQSFQAGQVPPRNAGDLSIADTVVPANLEAAVFVVNPADSNTYYYMEGMNAPMGNFTGYGHRARAATVVDRSLKEVEAGVYAAKVRLPVAGKYDVAFLLDNPKLLHCFFANVAEDPAQHKDALALAVEWVDFPTQVEPGQAIPVRLKLTEPRTGKPRPGLEDLSLLYYQSPGLNRSQSAAADLGGGLYEARVHVTGPGGWYLYVAAPSAGLKPGDMPFRTILARAGPGDKQPEETRHATTAN